MTYFTPKNTSKTRPMAAVCLTASRLISRLANTHLLRVPHSVVLWLVPSKTIRDQTVRGLKDCQHPLNAAYAKPGR